MIWLIQFILDVAGLLLWLNWRAVRFDPLARGTPATLAGTLRRAEPSKLKRWHFLAALAALLLVRALFYSEIGPPVNWILKMDLVVTTLVFRCDQFTSALLFSLLTFLQTLIVFYFWLMAIALINRRVTQPDPLHKTVLLHLGRIGRWPHLIQLFVPLLAVAASWIALHPLLTRMGVTIPVASPLRLVQHGLLVGSGPYLSLKFLLPTLLCLHLITSYIYFGNSPVWDFVGTTAQNTITPFKRLPLRFGKVDFAPLLAAIIVVLLLHVVPTLVLKALSDRAPWVLPQ